MKKYFIKNKLKYILIVGITAIICISGTAFAALQYQANSVSYTTAKNAEIKNVEEALNDLYKELNNNSTLSYITTLGSTGNTVVTPTYTFTKNYKKVIVAGNGTNNNNNINAVSSTSISSLTATEIINQSQNKKGDGSHYAGLYVGAYENVSANDVLSSRIGYGGQLIILGIE